MHAYLFWSILFGIVWLILFAYRKDLRREMLFSSLLFLPFGLAQALYVPEYWNPNVIYKFFGFFDIESLLWCFFTGGIVAVIYEEIFKIHLGNEKNTKKNRVHAYIVYFLFILGIFCLILIRNFSTWSVLRSTLVFAGLAFFYFSLMRPDLIKKSALSGVVFLIFYIASLTLVNYIFPNFTLTEWNIQNSSKIIFFSIIVEEYLYAFLFGLTWSVVYEEIKNVKLRSM